MFYENLRQALHSIRTNLTRSVLTILIIAFGITAIVGVLTSIEGVKYWLASAFTSLGSNSFKIENRETNVRAFGGAFNARRRRNPEITLRQAIAFKDSLKTKALVSFAAFGAGAQRARFQSKETNPNISVRGCDENLISIEGYTLAEGRALTAEDMEAGASICVVGDEIKQKLFPTTPGVGREIFVGKKVYRVVGVLKEKGTGFGGFTDKVVLIPYTTLRKNYSADRSYSITVYLDDPAGMPVVESISEGIFRQVRGLRPTAENDFVFNKSDAFVNQLLSNLSALTMGAIAISVITLFSASIGLMNIMLVSVTERTREIGVRKALGASKQNILQQFLIEAVTISQLGGLVGLVFGLSIGLLIAGLLGVQFDTPWLWIFVSIVVCLIVGVASGWYPARKAASLDPIEALRYE